MYLRDLEGNEYVLDSSILKSRSLNGNRSLTFVVYPTKTNKEFINELGELWQLVDNDENVWTIIYVAPEGRGDSLNVQVKAIPQIFDYLNTTRLYDELNEHMTANEAFTYIFNETPYNFNLMDSFLAVQWEGFGGGKTRLEQFKDALNRYGAEFTVVGNEVRLYKQIGRDTEFMYHYKLNASNISKESDAGELWTVARGYGDYEAGEIPGLEREYRSPLADVIGERHAPPLKDGRITNINTMDAKLKQLVDNSLKVSVKAKLHDLRKQGYPLAQPELGDRVFLIDDRINLKDEMRVVDIQEVEDYEGEIINFEVTFGSEELSKRRQSEIKHALKEITDIVEGRKKLPLSALDNAITEASRKLINAETEVSLTDNGILMISKEDPNKVVIANSEGIGVSTDGGASFENAITGEGINTKLLVAGTIDIQRLRITSGNQNVLWVDGETGKVVFNAPGVATKEDIENIELTPGPNGKTAYETALENGFTGTEQEWIHSLVGEKGDSGKTAYEVAVEDGFSGTQEEWLNSLKGPQGIPGPPGDDGTSQYVHIRYSANSSGSSMTTTPQSNTAYIGLANTTSPTAPSYTGFTWTLFKGPQGDQGIQGPEGSDGQPTYTWVKYADDKNGSGMSDTPDDKTYIGLAFNKTTQTESGSASDYNWSELPQNIEIGGRNLVIKKTLIHDGYLNDDGAWSSNSEWATTDYIEIVVGKQYIASGYTNLGSSPSTCFYDSSNDFVSGIRNNNASGAPENDERRLVTAPTGSKYMRFSFYRNDIDDIKLEKGNKATDYTEAPEDTQAKIDAKSDQENVDNLSEDLSSFESIAATKEELGEITSSLNDYMVELENDKERLATAKEDISDLLQRMPIIENNLGEFVEQWNFLDTYVRMGDEGLMIQELNGATGIRITTNRIDFLDGSGEPVAYITNQVMRINRGIFVDSAQIGEHKIETLSGGHTVWTWINQ